MWVSGKMTWTSTRFIAELESVVGWSRCGWSGSVGIVSGVSGNGDVPKLIEVALPLQAIN